MDPELSKAIDKARQLFPNNRHACIATVNEDGSPHNTPFFFLHERDLSHVYWGSHPRAQHSLNVTRNEKAFLALYNSMTPGLGGVYMVLGNCRELQSKELLRALKVHNEFRLRAAKAKTYSA